MRTKEEVVHEIAIADSYGRRLATADVNVSDFTYAKTVNGVGAFTLTIGAELPRELLRSDFQVQYYRGVGIGRQPKLQFLGFTRKAFLSAKGGKVDTVFAGLDQNCLVDRRVVAQYANTTGATASNEAADDVMKRVVTNAFDDTTWTHRALDSRAYFEVSSATSEGPVIDKSFAWRDLLAVLQDLNAYTIEKGSEVFFAVEVSGFESFRPRFSFVTYVGQPGLDHSVQTSRGASTGVLFGLDHGNVSDALLTFDFTQEKNFAYVGGQGQEEDRTIVTVQDATRSRSSAWALNEVFVQATNVRPDANEADNLTAVGEAAIGARRPIATLQATLLDTEAARFGRDWNHGDRVTVEAFGVSVDGVVRQLQGRLQNGRELVKAKVVGELDTVYA